MEHSFDVLIQEKEAIQTQIENFETFIDNHYKRIAHLKKEQISCEIKRREVNRAIDLIKYHNKIT